MKAYYKIFIMETIVEIADKVLNNIIKQNQLEHLRYFLYFNIEIKVKLNIFLNLSILPQSQISI